MADIFIPDTSDLLTTENASYTLSPAGVAFVRLTTDAKRSVDLVLEVAGGAAYMSDTSVGTNKLTLPIGTRLGLARGMLLDGLYFADVSALFPSTISVLGAVENQP